MCRLGNQRPRDGDRKQGGYSGRQRQRERPEDQDKQPDDKNKRQILDLITLIAARLLLIHLNRDAARQVHPQSGRQRNARDRRAKIVDQAGRRALIAAHLTDKNDELLGLPVRRRPEVENAMHVGNGLQLALQRAERRDIGPGQLCAVPGSDHRDRKQVRCAEWRGQNGGLLDRRTGGQELAVVTLRHAGQ